MEEKDRGLEKLGNSDSGVLSLRGSIALILAFCWNSHLLVQPGTTLEWLRQIGIFPIKFC